MKKYIGILAFTLMGSFASAQQLTQFSQYMINPFLINPAAAECEGHATINMGNRTQWAGLNNAPSAFFVSGHVTFAKTILADNQAMSLKTSNPDIYKGQQIESKYIEHTAGAYLISDKYSPFSSTSFYGSYAANMPIGKFNVALGTSVGYSKLKIDQSEITVTDETEDIYQDIIAGNSSASYLDFNLGLWVYSDKLFAGISADRIGANKIQFGSNPLNITLNSHYFITAGYKHAINENIKLIPSFLLRSVKGSPSSIDFNLEAEYLNKGWIGFSYRVNDAVVGMLGIIIKQKFKVGYSYDITTSDLSAYNSGSHEITLGINLK